MPELGKTATGAKKLGDQGINGCV
ncbi:protein of unknown function [Stenotrophomonas maltophilia]|nr:protein of unknown function [Stenotrophomonas maltophilia]